MRLKQAIYLFLFIFALQSKAEILIEENYNNIFNTLREHELSPEQIQNIQDLLKGKLKTKKRARSEIVSTTPPRSPKKQKVQPKDAQDVPPKDAQAVVQWGDTFSWSSPKKNGNYGEEIEDRKMGLHVRNRKNSIYIWTAVHKHEDEYIKLEDRINAETYFDNGLSLNEALLATEIKLRALIQKNTLLYKRTFYVGLCSDASDRANKHGNHFRANKDKSKEARQTNESRKIRWFDAVSDRGFNSRKSDIIENVPEKYLHHFEVMVGHIFNVTLKGSTTLGNKKAYASVQKYLSSKTRKEKLAKLKLDNVIETLLSREIDFLLGLPE